MTGKQAMLIAFDRLFDHAARKLEISCDDDTKADARRQFTERFAFALDAAEQLSLEAIPEEVMANMESALDGLSPAQLAGHLASIPIAHQAQQILQTLAFRAAEQKLLRHMIDQADESWGGN